MSIWKSFSLSQSDRTHNRYKWNFRKFKYRPSSLFSVYPVVNVSDFGTVGQSEVSPMCRQCRHVLRASIHKSIIYRLLWFFEKKKWTYLCCGSLFFFLIFLPTRHRIICSSPLRINWRDETIKLLFQSAINGEKRETDLLQGRSN